MVVARLPMVLPTASSFTSAPISGSLFPIFGIVRVCIMKLEIRKSNTPGGFDRYIQEEKCQKKEMGGFLYLFTVCVRRSRGGDFIGAEIRLSNIHNAAAHNTKH